MTLLLDSIEDVLGIRSIPIAKHAARTPWRWNSVISIADRGYPGVFSTSIFPTVKSIDLLRTGHLQLPVQCCICGSVATQELPLVCTSLLDRLKRFTGLQCDYFIPHCDAHGSNRGATFLLQIEYLSTKYAILNCCGLNREFLEGICQLYPQGDMYPPWEAFPLALPGIGWSQGLNEAWWPDAWVPFWNKLTQSEQDDYLARWDAPPDWEEALLFPGRKWSCPGIISCLAE